MKKENYDSYSSPQDSAEFERLAKNAEKPGPLAWFASNHVAANLLMLFLLIAGAMAIMKIKIEVFPEIDADMVSVQVPYLGATPSEVEQGVVLRVEEAIAGIEGIKTIRSTASEGIAAVTAELEEYADTTTVLNDIKSEVDRIQTFPAETEKPWYIEATNARQVITLMVSGDVSERTLKVIADRIKDDLTAMDNISQISISGSRDYEISIEISEETLRRYGLTFAAIGRTIDESSLDLPAGSIDTQGGEILIRTQGQLYAGSEFEDIVVMTQPDGTELKLSEIATVIDGFEDTDNLSRFDAQRAILLNVFRVGDQGALDVADTVKQYVEGQRSELPAGVSIGTWEDNSAILKSRISLLLRNAQWGLILVFLVLALMLDLHLAFWATMGIPISFLGSFFLLPYFDVSINMVSLFAFIVVLGIVVDDAIVVGENIFTYRQRGVPPLKAAIMGVREIAMPVVLAVLTTIAAFIPLLYVEGRMGKFLYMLPIVVVCVLILSLIESLLILPAHLSSKRSTNKKPSLFRLISIIIAYPLIWLKKQVKKGLEKFINGPFRRLLGLAVAWRYLTLALAIMVLIVILGIIQGGHIKVNFFPPVEGDNIVASLEMPQGAPIEETEAIVEILEQAARQVQREYDSENPGQDSIFIHLATTIGSQPRQNSGGPGGGGRGDSSSNLAEVNVELQSSENRDVSSELLANRWRELVGEIPGVSSLTFTSSMFTIGDDINVELSHRNFETLLQAVNKLKSDLAGFAGVEDITDSFVQGKLELKLSLNEQGRILGVDLEDLASQVRQGFYGLEVQRIQRGRDDVRVMLRYPKNERNKVSDIENMRIRLPDGTEVPFRTIAIVNEGRGYASINRVDRRRIVSVTADVNEKVANTEEVNQELLRSALPNLARFYPGLTYEMGGRQQERDESFGSMGRNFIAALLIIFGLLAIQFRSYIQPLIIMSAIPFGLVGAVIGHLIMGFDLTLLSMFGLVALTGVVVNDSLIMIDLINRERSAGIDIKDIIEHSATRRFRPILLTTFTTCAGLTPMILERSLQAQFLIPMAVSLGFGVFFATAITLVLVPCLYMILEDAKTLLHKLGLVDQTPAPQPQKPEPQKVG